jgi:ATP-dependent RNA helicase DeaD
MLRAIERATRQAIEPMNLPTVDAVNALRIAKFKQRVTETVAGGEASALRTVVEQLEAETGLPLIEIAAALASLSQGTTPLLLAAKPERPAKPFAPPAAARSQVMPSPPAAAGSQPMPSPPAASPLPGAAVKPRAKSARSRMETFRIEVGSVHGIRPGTIVGAIANEAGIEGVHIGRVDIREEHSFVDLPQGMPKEIFKDLQKTRVAGRELRISRMSDELPKPPGAPAGRRPAVRKQAGRQAERKVLRRRAQK